MALQEEKLYAAQGVKFKAVYLSNLLRIFPFPFKKKLKKAKYGTHGKLSRVFGVAGSRSEQECRKFQYF